MDEGSSDIFLRPTDRTIARRACPGVSSQMNRTATLSRRSRAGALALVATAVVALAACQKKEAGATQVAAKVNGDEITVHQIEFALRQQRNMRPEQADAA